MSRNLVIFYSRKGQNYVSGSIRELEKGNAAVLAEMIRDAADADLFEIRPVKEYPADYMACTEEAKAELRAGARPELREYLDGIEAYENIFVCGPCWWGTYPCAVFTQLEKLDLSGKKVLPVMSHEGSGLGSCEKDLKRSCRGAAVVKGLAVAGSQTAEAKDTVTAWVKKNL